MKGKLYHPCMSCFIYFFHRVSLWTNFLTINMWVPKKSLLPRVPKSGHILSSSFIPKISKYIATCGGQHYLEEKIGSFSIAFLKELAPFFFPSSLQNCWMIISKIIINKFWTCNSREQKIPLKHCEEICCVCVCVCARVEGTLYPWVSLLEIGRNIMPTPEGWDGNSAYL